MAHNNNSNPKRSQNPTDASLAGLKDLKISSTTNPRSPQRAPRAAGTKNVRVKPSSSSASSRSNQDSKSTVAGKGASKAIVTRSKLGITTTEYTCRPIVPASKAELLPVARAMHREEFAPRVKKLFDPEREAAIEAIQTGIYIGWRSEGMKHDCIRVGSNSKCFCGHLLHQHGRYNGHSVRVPCVVEKCKCKAFAFIPGRAEDVGEFWLQRRPNFDPSTWRAKCKCKHPHEEHAPNGCRACRSRGCGCSLFDSNFLCCACDKHWENHETVFETTDMRKMEGIPYGEDYLPFNEFPELRNVVLTGKEDDDSQYLQLTDGKLAVPKDSPTQLALQLRGASHSSFDPFGK